MMTDEQFDALAKLEAAATPGPWFMRELSDEICMSAVAVTTQPEPAGDDGLFPDDWPAEVVVAGCLVQSPSVIVPDDHRFTENAALIAAMRTALPELIRLARAGAKQEAAASR